MHLLLRKQFSIRKMQEKSNLFGKAFKIYAKSLITCENTINGFIIWMILESIPKPLSTVIGCKVRGSALSAKKVLDVLQYASEPFPPPALTTNFSLDLATKQVLG